MAIVVGEAYCCSVVIVNNNNSVQPPTLRCSTRANFEKLSRLSLHTRSFHHGCLSAPVLTRGSHSIFAPTHHPLRAPIYLWTVLRINFWLLCFCVPSRVGGLPALQSARVAPCTLINQVELTKPDAIRVTAAWSGSKPALLRLSWPHLQKEGNTARERLACLR